jgi:CHAD domain-containing protein
MYQFDPAQSWPQNIRRIAGGQIDLAVRYLENPGDDPDEAIHEARKCLKRVRALLRLVRPALGETLYRRENLGYRDAGRALSDARDVAVYAEILGKLSEHCGAQLPPHALDPLREHLLRLHRTTIEEMLEERTPGTVAERLRGMRSRLPAWPLKGLKRSTILEGLRQTYKRGRNRWRRASRETAAKTLHEWRKQVKYLWYHTQLLRSFSPVVFEAHEPRLHVLATHLGEEHDLAELTHYLSREPEGLALPNIQGKPFALIREMRRERQAAAWVLGEQLYDQKPSAFIAWVKAGWLADNHSGTGPP